jgi:hypothetical protein
VSGRLRVAAAGRTAELVGDGAGVVLRVARLTDALALARGGRQALRSLAPLLSRLPLRAGVQIGEGRVHRVLPSSGLLAVAMRLIVLR